MRIAVLFAMHSEKEACVESEIEWSDEVTSHPVKEINGHTVEYFITGVGKVNAAMNTQKIIDNIHPDLIINAGVCGATKAAYDENKVCDIVVSVEDDYDTSVFDGEDFEKNSLILREDSDSTYPILYTADHVTVESENNGYFDMEGYAVAKVAQANCIPVRLLKSVTDIIDSGEQDEQYKCNFNIATKLLKEKLSEFIRTL